MGVSMKTRGISLVLALALLLMGATSAVAQADPGPTDLVNIYLVALEDNGQSGIRIGCNDSLVPVETEIEVGGTTEEQIFRVLGKLFAIDDQFYGESGRYNSLYQTNLMVESVSVDRGLRS
jgi:hypothetical protein